MASHVIENMQCTYNTGGMARSMAPVIQRLSSVVHPLTFPSPNFSSVVKEMQILSPSILKSEVNLINKLFF